MYILLGLSSKIFITTFLPPLFLISQLFNYIVVYTSCFHDLLILCSTFDYMS